jgi:C4-dicarboxylate-specific signal transduction histidine kinase
MFTESNAAQLIQKADAGKPDRLGWPWQMPAFQSLSSVSFRVLQYGFALLCVLVALGLTIALQYTGPGRPSLFFFFVAIVASAWLGGNGPAVFAVLLSLLPGLYFYSTSMGSLSERLDNVLGILLLLFTSCAVAGVSMGSWRRKVNEALGAKAEQLQQANNALLAQIEDRKRAELALQEAQSKLARADRLTSIGELAATIAHEINQPLAAISNSAGACVRWLDTDPPDLHEVRQLASWIMRDSERASAVIGRVRAMIRNITPDKAPFPVNALLAETISTIEYDLKNYGVKVIPHFDPADPLFLGDRVQIQQVFSNILINAVEAMVNAPQRLLGVRTSVRDNKLEVEIEDTGRGFSCPPEMLFQPFMSTKSTGLGLGLAICRSIVETHQGELIAEPRPSGACFRLVLPLGD